MNIWMIASLWIRLALIAAMLLVVGFMGHSRAFGRI